jgi:predicted dehydrogenase
VVEKPFTIQSAEARSLISLANSQGKVLSVYHNRRYVSDYLTIKQIIKNGLLGEVHDFEAHYDRYRPEQRPHAWKEAPEEGSGILYDLGSHLFDQALQLFGKPNDITATVKMQRPHAKAVDYFDVRMDYGFLIVTLKAGMLVREQGPRYLIHGTLGSFIKYGEDPQEAALRAGKIPVGNDWGKEPEAFHGLIHTQKDNEIVRVKMASRQGHFGQYYEELRECLESGKQNPVTPQQAHDVIRCIELAMESAEKKQTITCNGFIS